MPHIVIEYAAPLAQQLSPKALVTAAHQGAVATGLFNPEAIKTRAYGCDDFQLGQGDYFVHVRMSIMPGRTDEQKQLLTQTVWQQLQPLLPQSVSVSLEVVDLHRESYLKPSYAQ